MADGEWRMANGECFRISFSEKIAKAEDRLASNYKVCCTQRIRHSPFAIRNPPLLCFGLKPSFITRCVVILLWALSIGCYKKSDTGVVYDVPAEFQKYIDSFELEARNHGQRIDIDNLIILYDNQLGIAFCGKCNDTRQDPTIQKIISINPNGICWDNAKELETLLFHELGHCVLGRGHVTSRLPNGDPKSIMIPDDLTIYAPCTSPIGAPPCDNYFKREYYLDELFDESTPIPWWAQ